MRELCYVVMLLAACTPVPRPVTPPVDDPPNELAVTADAGASIDAAPEPVVESRPDYVIGVDAGADFLRDECHDSYCNEAKLPPGVSIEDGVAVAAAEQPAWCATAGHKAGFCWPIGDAQTCRKRFSAPCKRVNAFACMLVSFRTTGKTQPFCTVTYGDCVTASSLADTDPEVSVVAECIIERFTPKRR